MAGASEERTGRDHSRTVLAGLPAAAVIPRWTRYRGLRLRLLLLLLQCPRRRLPRLRMVAVDVSQVTTGLDGVADAALQLLGLGEPAVEPAVPEDDAPLLRARGAFRFRPGGGGAGGFGRGDEDQLHDERAPRRGLQGDLPQRRRERREQLLRELWVAWTRCGAVPRRAVRVG